MYKLASSQCMYEFCIFLIVNIHIIYVYAIFIVS